MAGSFGKVSLVSVGKTNLKEQSSGRRVLPGEAVWPSGACQKIWTWDMAPSSGPQTCHLAPRSLFSYLQTRRDDTCHPRPWHAGIS